MNSKRTSRWVLCAALLPAAGLFFPAAAAAQQGSTSGPITNTLTQMDETQADNQIAEAYLRQTLGDPREEAAYQAFRKAAPQDPDKKIKLGNAFLAKYPSDRYSESVYEDLTEAYYDKKDLASFYTYSDKGLALFPDDVHLLALSGWVIPRIFTSTDPDGDKKLDKAESQSRHALDVLGKMQKPSGVSDQQFTAYKNQEAAEAHSGLGLTYFRQEKYDVSAKELQTAVAGEAKPDQTDLFVLGADYENLGQHKEAADAFSRCAQITGTMQDRCKQLADSVQKEASGAK